MKNRVSGIVDLLSGVLLALGPWFIFPVCSGSDTVMRCFYSARAITVLGAILLVVGLIKVVLKPACQMVCCLISAVIALGAMLIPAWAIGGCANAAMACQRLTFPCIYVVCIISGVSQLWIAYKNRKA